MRGARTVVLVLLLAGLSLYLARVRGWLRPSRRVVAGWVVALLVLAGVAVVLPDGWAPIPPGPGAWVTPSYVGRPVVGGAEHGPGGESPQVRTRSYGLDDCRRLEVDGHGRLVTVCGSAAHPVLRLADAESLRPLAEKELPARAAGCPASFDLDPAGRVHVAARARLPRFEVDIDGARRDVSWCIVGNARCYGGPWAGTPGADPFSPGFETVVLNRHGRRVVIPFFFAIPSGRHLRMRGVERFTSQEVALSGPEEFPYQLDGDPAGHLPVTARSSAERLWVIVPKEGDRQ